MPLWHMIRSSSTWSFYLNKTNTREIKNVAQDNKQRSTHSEEENTKKHKRKDLIFVETIYLYWKKEKKIKMQRGGFRSKIT